ncbi:hypothetical protein E2C01_012170 [Portunus trituberculatus]|uniref:Uncharacterized protein n=1 Tax=Portunus trituberculatus TaxID=210409 RepID=A0A5B7DDE8_PORTR|nr:hypothetical protein [Portunus trituberculatus]
MAQQLHISLHTQDKHCHTQELPAPSTHPQHSGRPHLSAEEVDQREEDQRGEAGVDQRTHKVPPLPPGHQLLHIEKAVPVVEGQLERGGQREERLVGVLHQGVDQVIGLALGVQVAVQTDEFSEKGKKNWSGNFSGVVGSRAVLHQHVELVHNVVVEWQVMQGGEQCPNLPV